MNDKENNSSSKDIKVIHIPHDQQEQAEPAPLLDIKVEPIIEPIDKTEEILIDDKTKFKKDGL